MTAKAWLYQRYVYLTQLWGGCESYLLRVLQVQMNEAARLVTGLPRFTSTRKLMARCGWLTAKQLVVYQSVIMGHKTILARKPYYLHSRLCMEYAHNTRQHTTGCIRIDQSFWCRSDLPRNSFRHRGAPITTTPTSWIEKYKEYGDIHVQTKAVDKALCWTRLDQKFFYDSPPSTSVLSLAAAKVFNNLLLKENKTYLLTYEIMLIKLCMFGRGGHINLNVEI